MAKYRNEALPTYLAVTRALSDETRVRALLALRDGELCLCHLIELLALSPSTVSKHLDVLYRAGLVTRRKEGRWHHFALADSKAAPTPVRKALRWTLASLDDDRTIKADAKRVRDLCCKTREEVSSCYRAD